MNRAQLAHALRAAADLLAESEFVVVGSTAILGSFPETLMTDALMMSTEVDLLPPDDPAEDKAIILDGAQGELSHFHQLHGFYIDGVSVNTSRPPARRRFVIAALRQRLTDPDSVLALIPTIDANPAQLMAAVDVIKSHRPQTTGNMTPQPVTDGVERPLKFEPARFTGPSLSDELRES